MLISTRFKTLLMTMGLWLLTVCLGLATEFINHIENTAIDELSSYNTERGAVYSLNNGILNDKPGTPELPYKLVRLALPENTMVRGLNTIGLDVDNIASNLEYAWCEGDIITDIHNIYSPAPRDEQVYGLNQYYPGHYAEIIEEGKFGNQPLVTIAVYPLQFRPSDGSLALINEIQIELELEEDPSMSINRRGIGGDLVRDLTDNPGDFLIPSSASDYYNDDIPGTMSMGLGAEYVIITSAELAPAFYPFAFWKNQKGILTEIVLIEDILGSYTGEDDPAQIRDYLKEAYAYGTDWVLLGGDESVIPPRYAYPGNTSDPVDLHNQQCTDLYYADLTGEWDSDGDGIYGEYSQDNADIYPEVYIGRIPATSLEEAEIWVEKALLYEQNPGHGEDEYLTKGLFITNDQMRDVNQHTNLAALMPDHFDVDASRCIEEPSGNSPSPTQPTGERIVEVMSEGWGFVSNLNHGGFYYYAAMTPYYNHAPRSNIYGDSLLYADNTPGALSELQETDQYGVHYSISCYTGAYDFDSGPYGSGPFITSESFAEAYLFLPDRGGVAFLGNTRWGWVYSSYYIEQRFLEYVYSDSARHLGIAETLSKVYYPNKRDLIYGHNLFGDPELKMWLYDPEQLTISAPDYFDIDSSTLAVNVYLENGNPAAELDVCFWKPGELYYRGTTDSYGSIELPITLQSSGKIYITATATDMLPARDSIEVTIQSGFDIDEVLPGETHLHNNYPNPFNSSTTVNYSLAAESNVLLQVYDIRGRIVKTLISETGQAGSHDVVWDGTNDAGKPIASGTYFYALKTSETNIVRKMTVVK